MTIDIQCKIIEIGATTPTTVEGVNKRTIVIATDEVYPTQLPIDFLKDKCELLERFAVGDFVTIGANIKGGKKGISRYVNLNGWKIFKTK
ncbi:DUF3127 domain-containing protein [Flavobacterium galactosidilyticum]|uniref:DUF3127 domain-containing protein n=1 Tax=Flavobacterium galactosidilyticum TaxID=2893886 RepID=UPI001E59E090|nr:DUF3127 domain-containing protein [Flavobacterium sp. F-340]UFH46944.1 DUF3127 domain-containing protein [Flavobacterium sp. F-340]